MTDFGSPLDLQELAATLKQERGMAAVHIEESEQPGVYRWYWKAPSGDYDYFVATPEEALTRIHKHGRRKSIGK